MEMTEQVILARAYDSGAEEEYKRLSSSKEGRHEFQIVCQTLTSLVVKGSVVYDIGCGPGRHTEFLLKKGYRVGCVDLSSRSLSMLRDRVTETERENLLFDRVCCATELDWIESASADAVLLLGPMYHLTREECRRKVIDNCSRILKSGGILLSMFMSPSPVSVASIPEYGKEHEEVKDKNNVITYTGFGGFRVPQYRCWPVDAVEEFNKWFIELGTILVDHKRKAELIRAIHANQEIFYDQFLVVYKKK